MHHMNPTLAPDHIPYPTPHLEGLFARLCGELNRIRQLVGEGVISVTVPMQGMTHAPARFPP